MQSKTLIRIDQIEIDGQSYRVEYYEGQTVRGVRRYSGELVLGPDDRIIVDGSSLCDLEWRVARFMPATIYSRALARTAAA